MTVWNRRSSAPSFSMYLRYSFERRRADALELAAGQRGLEHVRGVDRALGRAGTDQRVQFVDEEDDFLFWAISFITALSRSSNWPRYLVPAMTAAMSSDTTRWSCSTPGHLAL